MNTKHTPGPWEVRPTSNKGNGTSWRDIVATGGEFSPAYVGEALEHDARLIAAAPDLLAALEMTLAYLRREWAKAHSEDVGSAMRAVRSAIAKATGHD